MWGSSDQDGTGKGCPSCTGATSRGGGQPPQHQLPLNGSDGQRRSGEAAQLPPPATTVASLPRIQPGAAQASRPSARGPGAQGPMLQEEMGRIMPRRPGGGGVPIRTVPGPPKSYLCGPAVGPPLNPSSQPLQPASRRTPPPAGAAAPGLRSPGRRGRVGWACDPGEV